jgi:hypothetical protein
VTILPFPAPGQQSRKPRRPRKPTKRISLRQARCLMEGLSFARDRGTPLNAHLIVHWGGTVAGDDPDGRLFAKLRYLLEKRFRRKFGLELTAIWVRERHRNKRTRQQSEVVHSHILFHLPPRYRLKARRDVEELVTLVAKQIIDDRTIELTFPANPDGKYLVKGGTRAVWEEFRSPLKWRSELGEGLIEGKRCGVTQNLGPAAREGRHRQGEFYVAQKRGALAISAIWIGASPASPALGPAHRFIHVKRQRQETNAKTSTKSPSRSRAKARPQETHAEAAPKNSLSVRPWGLVDQLPGACR